MSLRNQPYLPLYVDDFLTDEKLVECSAATTGVYIRLLCIFHKSEAYGKILLKQKYKQNESNIKNFALQICRQMPFEKETIEAALAELIEERVLQIVGDTIMQHRMVRDGEISEQRAFAGKNGGKNKPSNKAKSEANPQANNEAKGKANTVIGIVNTNEDISLEKEGTGEETFLCQQAEKPVLQRMMDVVKKQNKNFIQDQDDIRELKQIAEKLADGDLDLTNPDLLDSILQRFDTLYSFAMHHELYANWSLSTINKHLSAINQSISQPKKTKNGNNNRKSDFKHFESNEYNQYSI